MLELDEEIGLVFLVGRLSRLMFCQRLKGEEGDRVESKDIWEWGI